MACPSLNRASRTGCKEDADHTHHSTIGESVDHTSLAGTLNARILRYTEDAGLRAETQAGFRPGLSTLHPILGLQHFVHAAKSSGRPLFACALDLKGAYDRVQRLFLWQVLQRLGIHGGMLATVQLVQVH